jgi:carbonic anhydrase
VGADELVERNARFAEHYEAGERTLLPDLGVLVVTCFDPRVDPALTLGLQIGDAAVIRGAGGRVTDRILADIANYLYFVDRKSQGRLGMEIMLVHHTECGAGRLTEPEVAARVAAASGLSPEEVSAMGIADPRESVVEDVGRLVSSELLAPRVVVSGWVYDVDTGRIDLVDGPAPLGNRRKGT